MVPIKVLTIATIKYDIITITCNVSIICDVDTIKYDVLSIRNIIKRNIKNKKEKRTIE